MYLLSLLFLLSLCFYAAYTDMKEHKIPNRIIAGGLFLRIIASICGCFLFAEPVFPVLEGALCAFLVAGCFYFISVVYRNLTGKPAFGGGDIKLLFMIGLFFRLPDMAYIVLYALLFGFCAGSVMAFFCKARQIPFAPAIFASLLFFLQNRFCPN